MSAPPVFAKPAYFSTADTSINHANNTPRYFSNGGGSAVAVNITNHSPAAASRQRSQPQPHHITQNIQRSTTTQSNDLHSPDRPSGKTKRTFRHILLLGGGKTEQHKNNFEENHDTPSNQKIIVPNAEHKSVKKIESIGTHAPNTIHTGTRSTNNASTNIPQVTGQISKARQMEPLSPIRKQGAPLFAPRNVKEGNDVKVNATLVVSRNNQSNNKRNTNWRCDICLVEVFDEYDQAVAHEKVCTGDKNNKKGAVRGDIMTTVHSTASGRQDGGMARNHKLRTGRVTPHAPKHNINTAGNILGVNPLWSYQVPVNDINNQLHQINTFVGSIYPKISTLNPPVPPFLGYPCFNPPMYRLPTYPWAYNNNMTPSFPQMSLLMAAPLNGASGNGLIQAGLHQVGNCVPTPVTAPVATPQQQPSTNLSYISKECCSQNLSPAEIPHDILDDEWENSTVLEKEISWLVEESEMFLPSSANKMVSENKTLLPIALEFAWKHGSLQAREMMWGEFLSKVRTLVKKLNSGESDITGNSSTKLTLVDGCDLLKSSHGGETNYDTQKFSRLRKEARHAIQLGFRRSNSIERELNEIHGFRWREAVEEVGEQGNNKQFRPAELTQPRHRRKRHKNAALLETALGQDRDSSSRSQSAAEDEVIASQVPPELTTLEDEVAWLVEESLILLPKDMTDPKNVKHSESVVSAGLVTKASEIKWDYVVYNASDMLKEELQRIGGIKRRPLQRIIRYHHKEVRIAFQTRRDDIASLILLRGYRRHETKLSLPSPELLVQTGLDKIWAVRLMRRRQNETRLGAVVSARDLESACNARIGDKEPKSRKRKSTTKSPKKPRTKKVLLAASQKAQSSILTAAEEEIAWLREEFELDTGMKCYDWEFIEKTSSLPLLLLLAEKRCAHSAFLSVAGVSKLRAMVRLNIPSVKEEYEQKRVDIRYAITQRKFRRDRSKHLPDIPSAPASFDTPVVRRNGTSVLDIEYAEESESVCLDDDSDDDLADDQSEKNGLPQESNDCKDGCISNALAATISVDASTTKKEEPDTPPLRNTPLFNDGKDDSVKASRIKKEEPNTPSNNASPEVAGIALVAKKEESIPTPNIASQEATLLFGNENNGENERYIGVKKEESTPTPNIAPQEETPLLDESCIEKRDENATLELARSDLSESFVEFDEESEDEVVEDDDEFEVSSSDESEDLTYMMR